MEPGRPHSARRFARTSRDQDQLHGPTPRSHRLIDRTAHNRAQRHHAGNGKASSSGCCYSKSRATQCRVILSASHLVSAGRGCYWGPNMPVCFRPQICDRTKPLILLHTSRVVGNIPTSAVGGLARNANRPTFEGAKERKWRILKPGT